MAFLPDNYEPPQAGRYFKPQPGENKIRLMTDAIIGTVGWKDSEDGGRKPHRAKAGDPLPEGCEDPKHFWAVGIWDMADSQIKVWEITQTSIRDALMALINDPDWGDPRNYGIKIHKSGAGMDTKYNVVAAPKQPASDEMLQALSEARLDLNALYSGGDPFGVEMVGNAATEEEDDVPF